MPHYKTHSIGIVTVLLFIGLAIVYVNDTHERILTSSEETEHEHVSGSTGVRFSGEKIRSFDGDIDISSTLDSSNSDNKIDHDLFPKESACKYSQWAVVTTIFEPTESIIGIAKLKKWCLVIVGDTATPDRAFYELTRDNDHVYYLSASYQKELAGNHVSLPSMHGKNCFLEMMPFHSFSRKNVGYLFAINYGAEAIFDFDDDNTLLPLGDHNATAPPPPFDIDLKQDRTVLLKFAEKDQEKEDHRLPFNPYTHMRASQQYSWPRGFPIDQLQDEFMDEDIIIKFGDLKLSSIGVIQSLCDGDPDNDAIFRMTRYESTKFTFDRSGKAIPLLIPSSSYTPYNAQATTHLRSAFWGMYLPITVPGRVTDIWRSYITQRIMKDLGLYLLYTPPIVFHYRSEHDYLSDFTAEADLYDKTTKLLEFLHSWSSEANNLPQRIFELWVELYERDYIGLQDVMAVKEWLHTLQIIGYDFPSVVESESLSFVLPQEQPTVNEQPYRSLPHLIVGNPNRPENAVVKLIMMTMNEWPLLRHWVTYHGHLIGFEHLYIIDSSTNINCISFLRYARDVLGANVLFSDADLNGMESLLTDIASHVIGSSDFIIKVDTDEFLTVYDPDSQSMTTSISAYLSGFTTNESHELHQTTNTRVGFVQGSFASKDICDEDVYSTPEKFPLLPVTAGGVYKAVFNSRLYDGQMMGINLGGHAHPAHAFPGETRFGMLHFHARCVEIEVENCKRAVERHHFIEPTDSAEEAKQKLAHHLRCPSLEDICNTCIHPRVFASWHKAHFLVKWLDCEERLRQEYYPNIEAQRNIDFVNAIQKATEVFDV